MTGWLAPLARALDARHEPLALFIRDDDAGWEDERLEALLDVIAGHQLAIDLAVIPTAVGHGLARALEARLARGERVGLHQHGYSHANHEPAGRKSEFGASRSAAAQASDVAAGQRLLRRWFGDGLDPIFTPPWNRCTVDTASALRTAGLRALSRDRSAGRLGMTDLVECPIDLDWFAKSKGTRLSLHDWAGQSAAVIETSDRTLGLMLHHAVTTPEDLARLDELFALFAAHPLVCGVAMRDVASLGTFSDWSTTCGRG